MQVPKKGDETMAVIFQYTRANAIEDGILVDVSENAKELGYKFPVAITRTAYEKYVECSEEEKTMGQDPQGRLWDILWMLSVFIKANSPNDTVFFQFLDPCMDC